MLDLIEQRAPGTWVLTIYFHSVGKAKGLGLQRILAQCQTYFDLLPLAGETVPLSA